MKVRIIVFISILISLSGCDPVEDKKLDSELEIKIDDTYIEIIPLEAKEWISDRSAEIMNPNEIMVYNNELLKENEFLFNLDNFLNLEKGIVIEKTLLRDKPDISLPAETALYINMPVVILEKQDDWYRVRSYFYEGWVSAQHIVLPDNNQYNKFINPEKFVVVTASKIEVNNSIIDMGVTLPYLDTTDGKYKILIPEKDKNGNLTAKELLIGRDKAHIGYLPYTTNNVYIQSFKYLGAPYGWGDENGIDCSSFIASVYRTFGIYLPRNSIQQNMAIRDKIDLADLSLENKYKLLDENNNPSILYMDGHIMLYLGKKDDDYYIINANGRTMDVAYEILPYSNELKSILMIH